MFGDIGGSEVILIMVVILIFFGANKIPELARGLGKGIREFKDASTEIRREFEQSGQPAQPNYTQQVPPAYDPQPVPHAAGLPVADASYDAPMPSAAVAAVAPPAVPTADAAYVAPTLPPNMAPEGTQPRQPYRPVAPDA